MKRVFVASPYAGEIERNVSYAYAALYHTLSRGEAGFAPHLLYPNVLNDSVAHERELGIKAGMSFLTTCDTLALYVDHGISSGMQQEIELAKFMGIHIEERRLFNDD